jgi:hypothetical protein
MMTFLWEYPEGGAGARPRKEAIENIRNNIAWAQRNVLVIEKCPNNNSSS